MGRPPSEKAVWRAAVDDLQEQLAHGGVDGVAHQVGVQRLEDGLAGQDLGGHGGGVGHAGAADGLDQGFLDDALLDVQGQLAGALLGRAPAHAVGEAGDVLDLLGLHPPPFLGDGRGTVVGSLGHAGTCARLRPNRSYRGSLLMIWARIGKGSHFARLWLPRAHSCPESA